MRNQECRRRKSMTVQCHAMTLRGIYHLVGGGETRNTNTSLLRTFSIDLTLSFIYCQNVSSRSTARCSEILGLAGTTYFGHYMWNPFAIMAAGDAAISCICSKFVCWLCWQYTPGIEHVHIYNVSTWLPSTFNLRQRRSV